MADWIEAAAKEIGSAHLNSALEPTKYSYPTDKMIADIILRHAPPQPEWRERPTCAGLWACVYVSGKMEPKLFSLSSLEIAELVFDDGILWHPLPPIPPAQETK